MRDKGFHQKGTIAILSGFLFFCKGVFSGVLSFLLSFKNILLTSFKSTERLFLIIIVFACTCVWVNDGDSHSDSDHKNTITKFVTGWENFKTKTKGEKTHFCPKKILQKCCWVIP